MKKRNLYREPGEDFSVSVLASINAYTFVCTMGLCIQTRQWLCAPYSCINLSHWILGHKIHKLKAGGNCVKLDPMINNREMEA